MINALSICTTHYIESGKKNGCGKCPIIKECQSPHEWSQAGVSAWRDKCETAAVNFLTKK